MIPEKIEVIDADGLTLKRVNILSIDQYPASISNDILEFPVGYGCAEHLNADRAEPGHFWEDYAFQDARVKLEVSATRMSPGQRPGADRTLSSSTDTIYVELAHASRIDANDQGLLSPDHLNGLLLAKIKSQQQETRTILNHPQNVKYHIDLRSGKCDLSHMTHKRLDEKGGTDLNDEIKLSKPTNIV